MSYYVDSISLTVTQSHTIQPLDSLQLYIGLTNLEYLNLHGTTRHSSADRRHRRHSLGVRNKLFFYNECRSEWNGQLQE
jgi:hypothetical protein